MGRPTGFKREQLLGDVTELFWRQGYFATSVADLTRVTGLNPGSLYYTFDNKLGLLKQTLDFYGEGSIKRVRKSLQQHAEIDSAVAGFFYRLIDSMIEDPDDKGCFLVNICLEMAAHDPTVLSRIQNIFSRIELEFQHALETAKGQGQLKAEADTRVLATYLMMTIWGLRVMGRMKPQRQALTAVVDQSLLGLQAVMTRQDYDLAL